MKTPADFSTLRSRACHVSSILIAAILAGCAHAPLQQATAEIDATSTAALASGVVAPLPLRQLQAKLPGWLDGSEGTVVVHCTIAADGWVWDVRTAYASDPDLAPYAMDAVSRWRFAPGTRDGRPVSMRVSIPVQFVSEPVAGRSERASLTIFRL